MSPTPVRHGVQRKHSAFALIAALVLILGAAAISQGTSAHAQTTTNGSITITKVWDGGTGTSASFTATGTGVSDFSLTPAASSTTFSDLAAGQYSFTEAAMDGWTLTGVGCSDQPVHSDLAPVAVSHTLNLTLGAGENVTCTFTNTAAAPTTATLTVVKTVDNTQNPSATATAADFSLHVMSNGADVANSPQPGSETGTAYTVAPGDYAVSETGGPTGYTEAISGDCGTDGSITLAAGDNKTCTITNTAQPAETLGNITITKTWVGLNGETTGPDAVFTATGPGTSGFTLSSTGTDSQSFAGVASGSYTFTEAAVDGWKLTAINCTGQNLATTIGIDITGGTLSVGLGGDSEDITCAFVNTQVAPTGGSITIKKVWNGPNGPDASFTTSGTGVSDFTLTTADDSQTFSGLDAGTYSFTEAGSTGWNLTGISCSDMPTREAAPATPTSHTLNVELSANENVTCTFTNTPVAATTGTLTVIKMVDNTANPGATATPADFMMHVMNGTTDVTGSPQAGSATGTPYMLDPGTYMVSETGGPSGYTATFSGDCDSTGAVTLAAGDNLTCTITNTAAAAGTSNVTITKTWSGADQGPDAVFTDTGSGVSGFTLTSAGTTGANEHAFSGLAAGSYSFTETPVSGWTLTSINCTGQTIASTITTNLATGTVSIGLGAGEDVTCEFVNTEASSAPLLFNISPFSITAPTSPTSPTSPTTGTTASPPSNGSPATSTSPINNTSPAPVTNVLSSTPPNVAPNVSPNVSPSAPSTGTLPSSAAAPAENSAVLGAFSNAPSFAPAAASPSAPNTGSGTTGMSNREQFGLGALGLFSMALGFAAFAFARRKV